MLKISTVSYQEKSMDNYNNNGYDNGYNNNDNRNNNHNNNNNNKKPKNVNLIIFIIIAAVVTFIGLTLLSNMFRNATYKEISYDQFMQMIGVIRILSCSNATFFTLSSSIICMNWS